MIAVTLGDPNGVGPEIAVRSWVDGLIDEPWLLVGDRSVVDYCCERLSLELPIHSVTESGAELRPSELNLLDLGLLDASAITPGRIGRSVGAAALEYVARATELARSRKVEAIVTLPLNKEAVRLSQAGFSGHTEFIAEACGISRYTMMLASERLIVTHVSTHVPLREAIERVTPERVLDVISLTAEAVGRFRPAPRIAVAGLNPHAGEHGAFGSEDETRILPAIEAARKQGIAASGPEPPDTVFHRAVAGAFDAVVCMYHDQGHIPMKLLGFDEGVNVTLGLPIVRTSVDHGTAYDIAYQGTASTTSFVAAFQFAQRLIGRTT